MGTFDRILFCTDFSENADAAFSIALEQALRSKESELHVLHIVPESEAQFWKSYMYEVVDVDEKAKRDIDEYIDRVYRSQVPSEQTLTVESRVGHEPNEILNYARENDIELIVMGRQGKSRIESVLFGKVTEKVSRHAECAVLILPQTFIRKRNR